MNEIMTLVLVWVGGLLLGVIFFGGLWVTVHQSLQSSNPVVWTLGSFVVRTAITITGFYYLGADQWQRLLCGLFGFILARMIITKLTRPLAKEELISKKNNNHEA